MLTQNSIEYTLNKLYSINYIYIILFKDTGGADADGAYVYRS